MADSAPPPIRGAATRRRTAWRTGSTGIRSVTAARRWPDWYHLAPAFVAARTPHQGADLEAKATFLAAPEIDDHEPLTEDDHTYLEALSLYLDMYPEMRKVKE
jgi:hypothetical protein